MRHRSIAVVSKVVREVRGRHHVAHDVDSGHWTMTARCTHDGISGNTGYGFKSHAHRRVVGRASC